ncbi:MAG: hypothetical protein ACLSAF_17050 [Intestinimonas sp.]
MPDIDIDCLHPPPSGGHRLHVCRNIWLSGPLRPRSSPLVRWLPESAIRDAGRALNFPSMPRSTRLPGLAPSGLGRCFTSRWMNPRKSPATAT